MDEAHDQPEHIRPSPARPAVRVTFWVIVLALWVIPTLVVAGLVGFAVYGGSPSGVAAAIARSDSSAVVLQLGPPSTRDIDGQLWADMARPEEGCKTQPVGEAWIYSHWFANDGLVIFDRTGRVQCIREGGSFFSIRSY